MTINIRDGDNNAVSLRSSVTSGGLHINHNMQEMDTNVNIARGGAPSQTLWKLEGQYTIADGNEHVVRPPGGSWVTPPSASVVSTAAGGNAADDAAGTGARTVYIIGVNNSGALVTDTISLAGASAGTGVVSMKEILYGWVDTAGSGGVNAGNITLQISSTTRAVIPTGKNVIQKATFTVPSAQDAYVTDIVASNPVSDPMRFSLYRQRSGGLVYPELSFIVVSDTKTVNVKALKILGGESLFVTVQRVSGSGVPVVSATVLMTTVDTVLS